MKAKLRTLISLLLGAIVLAVPIWAMVSSSSCAAPPTPARVAQAAKDLCALRAFERVILEAAPQLQPPSDSIRATVQRTEDQLCAGLDETATPPPLEAPPLGSTVPAEISAPSPPPAPS